MTHLEIHKKLEIIEHKLGSYIVANQVGIKEEMFAFQYSIVSFSLGSIVSSMTILETQKKFCIACFYVNLKTLQQSLNRYIKIDNPKNLEKPNIEFEADYEYISEINTHLKDIVIKISHLAVNKDCEKVVNTAYDELKHINRDNDDDEDDEDYGEDWKNSLN